eukprot:TRINITY_DN6239_c0_g2_i4.p1 TRINITY_DN6239_c0_g2~~TRINITY_DN6239_c0_g2_i4.p1  ORF type:complete len:370 (-),score=75.80 TRINITY_DN6239_c0_g2_i4:25-1134(-)
MSLLETTGRQCITLYQAMMNNKGSVSLLLAIFVIFITWLYMQQRKANVSRSRIQLSHVSTLDGFTELTGAGFSCDGTLAVCDIKRKVTVYAPKTIQAIDDSLSTLEFTYRFDLPEYPSAVAWSSNQNHLIVALGDSRVVLGLHIGPDSHKELWRFATWTQHKFSISAVGLSANDKYAFTHSEGTEIKIWRPQTGERLFTLDTQQMENFSIAFTPNNRFISAGCFVPDLQIWELKERPGKPQAVFDSVRHTKELKGHKSAVNSICFNADSSLMVSGSKDGTWRLWDVAKGECLRVVKCFSDSIDVVSLSPDGQLVVVSGDVNMVVCTIAGVFVQARQHDDPIKYLSWSHDSRLIAAGAIEGWVNVWEVKR